MLDDQVLVRDADRGGGGAAVAVAVVVMFASTSMPLPSSSNQRRGRGGDDDGAADDVPIRITRHRHVVRHCVMAADSIDLTV